MLMLGDAAGMITPLCGNGMSMAMHASKLAYEAIHSFLLLILRSQTGKADVSARRDERLEVK